jgi:hypothetical protein
MKKEIFINESMGETRIAIQEDGQIVEVYIERQDKQRMVGNIYFYNLTILLDSNSSFSHTLIYEDFFFLTTRTIFLSSLMGQNFLPLYSPSHK